MPLSLVPCEHYWLEMVRRATTTVAICKHCRKRGEFTQEEWKQLAARGACLNKPIRV